MKCCARTVRVLRLRVTDRYAQAIRDVLPGQPIVELLQ